MESFDTVIRGGWVVDGTGAPGRYADVGIREGRVAKVGDLAQAHAEEVIEADGRIVAPGHITQHAHYDAALFWSPHCLDSGPNAVTSIVNANCGFSVAPVRPADRERTMAMLSTTEQIPVEQQRIALSWTWETFPEFIDLLRSVPKGVNILTYLPVNPLLIYVMGVDGAKHRRPTKVEMAQMHKIIHEAMDCGALGLSMSVMGEEGNSHVDFDGTPMPTDSLHDDDIVELCRPLVERRNGLVQVLAQIGGNGNRAVSEKIARLAKGSGVRVIHNIFLAVDGHPEMIDADLAWLDSMRAEGLDISGATLLHAGWVEAGIRELDTAAGQMRGVRDIVGCSTAEEVKALLADPAFVKRFSDEYLANGPSNGAGGFEQQVVIDVGGHAAASRYIGKSLGQIAEKSGRTVVEVLCQLALETDLAVQIKSAPYAALDARLGARLLAHPGVSAGVSDGGAHTKAFSSGFYATEMLIRMVREQKAVTLEDMHFQLSFKVARTLNLDDRGALIPGFWADVVIYNLNDLYFDRNQHDIVHDMPGGDWRRVARSGGYSQVLVNGATTFVNGKATGQLPGVLIGDWTGAPLLRAAE